MLVSFTARVFFFKNCQYFRYDGPLIGAALDKDATSGRGTRLKEDTAEAIVASAKLYIAEGTGCLLILCEAQDIPFFQRNLWVDGKTVLKKHHSFYFGDVLCAADGRMKFVFEVKN